MDEYISISNDYSEPLSIINYYWHLKLINGNACRHIIESIEWCTVRLNTSCTSVCDDLLLSSVRKILLFRGRFLYVCQFLSFITFSYILIKFWTPCYYVWKALANVLFPIEWIKTMNLNWFFVYVFLLCLTSPTSFTCAILLIPKSKKFLPWTAHFSAR